MSLQVGLLEHQLKFNDNRYLRRDGQGDTWTSSTGVITANGISALTFSTGTANYVPKWISGNKLQNSRIFDNGTLLGFGTASPLGAFAHFQASSAGGALAASGTSFVLEKGDDVKFQFLSPNAKINEINFGDQDSAQAGYLTFDHATDILTMGFNGSPYNRFNSTGTGLGTATITERLNINGNIMFLTGSDKSIYINQSTTGNGNALTIRAGQALAAELSGGTLYLHGGWNNVASAPIGNIEIAGSTIYMKYQTTTEMEINLTDITIASNNLNLYSDNQPIKFGAGLDSCIYYDGTQTIHKTLVGTASYLFDGYSSVVSNCTVTIKAGESKDAILHLISDEGDNNGDNWRIRAGNGASSNFYLESYATGAWVSFVTVLPSSNNMFGFNTTPATNVHVYEANTDIVPAFLVEQNSTGDASIRLLLTGGQNYTIGIDNSSTGDLFCINAGASAGVSTHFQMNSTGQIGIGVAPVSNVQLYSVFTSTAAATVNSSIYTDIDWTAPAGSTARDLEGYYSFVRISGTNAIRNIYTFRPSIYFYGSGNVANVYGFNLFISTLTSTRAITGDLVTGFMSSVGGTSVLNVAGNGYQMRLLDYTPNFTIAGTAYGIYQDGTTLTNAFAPTKNVFGTTTIPASISTFSVKSSALTTAGGIGLFANGTDENDAGIYEIAAREGALHLDYQNSNKILLRANGASYINGGNLGIGVSPAVGNQLDVLSIANLAAVIHIQPTTGTYRTNINFENTGGIASLGLEASVTGSLFTGSTPYAFCLGTSTMDKPIEMYTNNTKRLIISSTGVIITAMAGGGNRYVYVDNNGVLTAGAAYP